MGAKGRDTDSEGRGTMRVYRFDNPRGLDGLALHDEPTPSPQRGELLVKIRAVSLNYRDIAIPLGRYVRDSRSGLVPCSDAAAEVVDVGEGVEDYRRGDRVVSTFHPRWFGGPLPATANSDSYGSGQDGWLTEYKVVSRESVVQIPAGLSDEQAATLPCAGVTAWNALAGPAPIRAGQTVLTLGSGGVSIFALQLAKVLGARAIATTSSDRKAQTLKSLGADEVVNYRNNPEWGEQVRQLTDGRGAAHDFSSDSCGPSVTRSSAALRTMPCGGAVVPPSVVTYKTRPRSAARRPQAALDGPTRVSSKGSPAMWRTSLPWRGDSGTRSMVLARWRVT